MQGKSTPWLLLITAHFLFCYFSCGWEPVKPYLPFEVTGTVFNGAPGDTIIMEGYLNATDTTGGYVEISHKKIPLLSVSKNALTFIIPADLQSGDINLSMEKSYYAAGYLYVTRPAIVTTIAGTGAASFMDGAGGSAAFNYPAGMVIGTDSNLYVADVNNQAIRKISLKDYSVTSIPIPATIGQYSFQHPYLIAEDPSTGNLYVSGKEKYVIKITKSREISMVYTKDDLIAGLAVASGKRLLISTPMSLQVQLIDTTGNVLRKEYDGSQYGRISYYLRAKGRLLVSLASNDNDSVLVRLNADVVFPKVPVSFYSSYTWSVIGMDLDQYFIADNYTNQVTRIINPDKNPITQITGSGQSVDIDGVGSAAAFDGIQSMAADASGNVYISTYNLQTHTGNKIRKLTVQ